MKRIFAVETLGNRYELIAIEFPPLSLHGFSGARLDCEPVGHQVVAVETLQWRVTHGATILTLLTGRRTKLHATKASPATRARHVVLLHGVSPR